MVVSIVTESGQQSNIDKWCCFFFCTVKVFHRKNCLLENRLKVVCFLTIRQKLDGDDIP